MIGPVGPTMLLIFDGFGYRHETAGNAIAAAKMPTWKSILKKYPHTLLQASGRAVGLPDGFMGNSEVGHLCIGAGRVIKTLLCKFNDSIHDGTFFKNQVLRDAFSELVKKDAALHLIGLLSDAGVHSHEDHFFAIIKLAKQVGVKKIYIHPFLDGRDTPPQSAKIYLDRLQKKMGDAGKIASIHGRFYAMDRDKNWDRTQKSYDVICGKAEVKAGKSWEVVVDESYKNGIYDEFIEPTLLEPEGVVRDDDLVFFVNFRPDRAKQLTSCFLSDNKKLISTVRYDASFENGILFEDEEIKNTLLDEIAHQSDKTVFIIAETEKYAHVTYFFRGKVDREEPNEQRVLVPSKKVKTYVDIPEMSAEQITQKIVESLSALPRDFYLVNYANCDMVGHSGDFDAVVKACECLDKQLAILHEEVVEKRGGTIFLTGDHGNAEEMDKKTQTSHTTNPVPFVVIGNNIENISVVEGEAFPDGGFDFVPRHGLSYISPTILRFLGLSVPVQMKEKK